MLEFISAPEAAKKWGISERRVQKLCEENRIPGVVKFSRLWLIPKDAEKPVDKRHKKVQLINVNRLMKKIYIYFRTEKKRTYPLVKISFFNKDIDWLDLQYFMQLCGI